MHKSKLEQMYYGIKQRCYNKNRKAYPRYGGRGIVISPEWKHFREFEKWAIENGYHPGLDIDRIDNNGNYTPDNCRFVTHKKNCNNRSNCKYITFNGETKTVAEWADEYKIRPATLYKRLNKGMSFIDAVSTPVCFSKNKKIYNILGEQLTIDEICEKYNIPMSILIDKLCAKHLNAEQVVISMSGDISYA